MALFTDNTYCLDECSNVVFYKDTGFWLTLFIVVFVVSLLIFLIFKRNKSLSKASVIIAVASIIGFIILLIGSIV